MRLLKYVILALSLLGFVATGLTGTEYFQEARKLSRIADDIYDPELDVPGNVARMNAWVYANKGFAKNRKYLLFPALGPTPEQVLEHGGDCADKSRLLSALLRAKGIKSTLVMLQPCRACASGHTVVEASWAGGGRMVVDPVYNISFPRAGGGWYALRELRDDPGILQRRLDRLVRLRGEEDKIARYDASADGSTYVFPKTINWDRNGLTRFAGRIIGWFVDDPFLVYRPHVLENPRLGLLFLASGLGLSAAALWLLLEMVHRRRQAVG